MNRQQRIALLIRLGDYILENDEAWQQTIVEANRHNAWFAPEFINIAANNIATKFLNKNLLNEWLESYQLQETAQSKIVGVVMAGNIPLVGFHDFLCVFISGHKIKIKPSSNDTILITHLINKLSEWNDEVKEFVSFADMLKNCDAYIATGSNNSARYFEYYFSKYPHIIRRNKTSVAVLDGKETAQELQPLAEDIQLYFGLGCRNVTKLYVPQHYDFIPLLTALKKYDHFLEHHKYKNNFDYQLAILIMNNKLYMNSGAVILIENETMFSPVSQVHYQYYDSKEKLEASLKDNQDIQCIIGHWYIDFGKAQEPGLFDYADGIDTMDFLKTLGYPDKQL